MSNIPAIAAALRALADAIESDPVTPAITGAAVGAQAAAAAATPKPRGRPPKGEGTTQAYIAPTTAAAPTSSAQPVQPVAAAPDAKLTHKIVAEDFKAAATKHGVAFVKGLLTQYAKGATFDTVPAERLGDIQAALRAGPQTAAPKAAPSVDDLLG